MLEDKKEKMTMVNAQITPNKILLSFIQEKLSGDIERLKDYCFADLKGSPWGKCNSSFDCDNTLLANAIYILLWGGRDNFYSNLTLENVGTHRIYRGDTMNSFRSVLGKYEESFSYWEKIGMAEKVSAFFRKYHTLGNFTVLPNKEYQGTTFNMERGCKYGDFFDRFLMTMEKVMLDEPEKDEVFYQLKEANRECFNGKTLQQFSDTFFWDAYMTANKPKVLFAPHWTLRKRFYKISPASDYAVFAEKYIDEATRIINCRAEKMIAELKKNLY